MQELRLLAQTWMISFSDLFVTLPVRGTQSRLIAAKPLHACGNSIHPRKKRKSQEKGIVHSQPTARILLFLLLTSTSAFVPSISKCQPLDRITCGVLSYVIYCCNCYSSLLFCRFYPACSLLTNCSLRGIYVIIAL